MLHRFIYKIGYYGVKLLHGSSDDWDEVIGCGVFLSGIKKNRKVNNFSWPG
jgi:hypothetical protein